MAKTSQNPQPKPVKKPEPKRLLTWYDTHKRPLPWRAHAGRAETPYHTWIAEIMLQQTTVTAVISYYQRFISLWPDVHALAAADEDAVLRAWAGLGYYSRARNLLRCARAVVSDHDGVFPDDVATLKALPGIGEYTANAIRAIAFDKPANVVDGNVERVMARLHRFPKTLDKPAHKNALRALAAALVPRTRHGDYAQALMDLGATLCTPRNPSCDLCPWQSSCAAYAHGDAARYPVPTKKKKIPIRRAIIYIVRDTKGRVLMRRRPSSGLFGGMWEFPSTPWREDATAAKMAKAATLPAPVRHTLSHFKLELYVQTIAKAALPRAVKRTEDTWVTPENMPALPTIMRKVWEAASAAKPLGGG
jgi:A/G-specific adenine glycosylase